MSAESLNPEFTQSLRRVSAIMSFVQKHPVAEFFERGGVRGYLHRPEAITGDGIALTHGAGGDCQSRLLMAVSSGLRDRGFLVLRFDLPFRQVRRHGPPMASAAAQDRAGIRAAVAELRAIHQGRIVIGGHSYGGRQSSMLVAEDPQAADALLLLSYPLHPPRKPDQLRTAHLPDLSTPTLFIHGSRDPFGSPEELTAAAQLMPGPSRLSIVPSAGHDLLSGEFDLDLYLAIPLSELLDSANQDQRVTKR